MPAWLLLVSVLASLVCTGIAYGVAAERGGWVAMTLPSVLVAVALAVGAWRDDLAAGVISAAIVYAPARGAAALAESRRQQRVTE